MAEISDSVSGFGGGEARPLRIGYLAQHFLPEIGALPARASEMALRWQETGAEVTILTAMPHRPHGVIPPEYRNRAFMEERWEEIRVLRSWVYASPKAGLHRTLLNNATFMLSSAAHGMARAGGLDVLIASSPPFFVHAAGEALRRRLKVPLVLELRDLWPDYLVEMGVVRHAALKRALFAAERALLRRAVGVVVISESFKSRVVEKGVDAERVTVIPNGVDTDLYYAADEAAPLPALERRGGELIVGYLGNFGAGQELRTVVEAAALLRERAPEVRFVLAGDGTEKHKVLAHARNLGLGNLSIHASIAKERTRSFYNACDVCLVPLAPLRVFQDTIPSKIFEVMACERPVLGGVSGEARRIIRESGGGSVCAPGDSAALAEEILRMRELPPEQRARMGERGRAYVMDRYRRDLLADRYLHVLRAAAGTSTSGTVRDAAAPGGAVYR
jgi:colanic acid biosynthesis glycosyl transferase WcaI